MARLGGDEFAILLTGLADIGEAQRIAARIADQFQDPFELSSRTVSCTVSIGIAPCNEAYQSIAEIIRDADTAMYSAKAAGRSRCELLTRRCGFAYSSAWKLRTIFAGASKKAKSRFFTRQRSGSPMRRSAALKRWRGGGTQNWLIPPAEFIPIAEDSGVIHELGMSVLDQACAQMRRWQLEYPTLPPLEVSVNLSPLQFRQPDLVEQITRVVNASGIPANSLHLEITESVLMDNTWGPSTC